MDTDRVTLDDLAILRSAFENGTPLGWEAVHAFEEQQGIVLPEPYRTFVAEITDGAPDRGLRHGHTGLARTRSHQAIPIYRSVGVGGRASR